MRYPAFLKLDDKPCVVIGAGRVAERRVRGLCDANAQVQVVGMVATEGIVNLAAAGAIRLCQRAFAPRDLEGFFLAMAATDNARVNRAVQKAARHRGVLFCGADSHTDSDFTVPAVVRRGALQLAISTDGKSPAYAKLLRRELEIYLEEGHAQLLDLLCDLRPKVHARFPDAPKRREKFWQRIVTPDTLTMARRGQWAEIEERIKACLSSSLD